MVMVLVDYILLRLDDPMVLLQVELIKPPFLNLRLESSVLLLNFVELRLELL